MFHAFSITNNSYNTQAFITSNLRTYYNKSHTLPLEFLRTNVSEWILHFTLISPKFNYQEQIFTEQNLETEIKNINKSFATIVSYFELKTDETVNPYVYRKCLIKADFRRYSFFFQKIFTWIDASAQVILPFIIMLICNVNIIHKVLLTKNKTNGKNVKRLRKIKGSSYIF